MKLGPGESVVADGWRIVYVGYRLIELGPSFPGRTRNEWSFEVTGPDGSRFPLSYSEGFPGGMAPRPRVKVGYRRFLCFDWQALADSAIDLQLTPSEDGPAYDVPIPLAVDTVYEFPDIAVSVAIAGEAPGYTDEQIETLARQAPQMSFEDARAMYAAVVVKQIVVTTMERGKDPVVHRVGDNALYAPTDVSEGRGDYAVWLAYSSEQPGQLTLSVAAR